MAFLRFRTASPSVPTADETLSGGLSAAQIDGNFKSLNDSKPENNGTGASGTWSISISGNAATASSAAIWTTSRLITIGSTSKSVNGSSNVSWSLSDIGAAASNQTMFIGTTSVEINRTSGTLALTGISSITSSTTLSLLTPNTTSANSSDITIASGNTTTSGNSGAVTITSGSIASGSSNSGAVTITSGTTVTGVSGNVWISTASSSSTGSSGNVYLTGGEVKGNAVNAGRIIIQGANTSNTTGSNNGHVIIAAGSPIAAVGTKYGGKVYIDGGRPAAGGTIVDDGEVLIGTLDTVGGTGTRNIRVGHASATTTITGTVQLPTVGTSGFVKLGASGQLSADTNTYALSSHTHAASDITSGTIATARLGSGTANSTTFLRGDQTWASVISGATITNDTTTNADTFYIGLTSNQTSGAWTSAIVSSTKLYFNPSSGQLSATLLNSLSDIKAVGTVTAQNFDSVSDIKYKENVETLHNGLSKVLAIDPVGFTWKKDKSKSYGFIAQQLETVVPEAVNTRENGDKVVNYDMIIAFLVSAIHELSNKYST